MRFSLEVGLKNGLTDAVSTAPPLSPTEHLQRSGVVSVERVHRLHLALLSGLGSGTRRLGRPVVVVPGELAVGADVGDETVAIVTLRRGAGAAVGGRGEEHGAAVAVHVGGSHDGKGAAAVRGGFWGR